MKFLACLSLSVTKWIHLNWGDSGIVDLFIMTYHALHRVRYLSKFFQFELGSLRKVKLGFGLV